MPNTVVKLTNAESTWLEAAREDRKLLIKKKALTVMVSAFLLCATFEVMGFCGGNGAYRYSRRFDALRARVEAAAGPDGPGLPGFCL
jgi:hypothetical protein